MSRWFLLFCAAVYLGFGAWVLASPATGLAYMAVDLDHVNALSELRGTHGGINVLAGLFLAYAALNPPWRRAGLGLVALFNGGYVAGRLVASAADGLPERTILLAWGFEFLLLLIAVVLWSREPRMGRAHG
jgi:hypothetical protein